jgi:hypothetical protein
MKKLAVLIMLGMGAAGCATSNAMLHMAPDYAELPASDLRELADGIESVVVAGQEDFELPAAGSIAVDTPEIRQAIRTRAIRSSLVSELLDTGFAVEEGNGLIAVRRSGAYKKATTSQQRDRDALIVMSENRNRWTIYEGLLEANNWPPRSLSAIQETFFQARVPLMEPGQVHDEAAAAGGASAAE